jgi:hypothetical protein
VVWTGTKVPFAKIFDFGLVINEGPPFVDGHCRVPLRGHKFGDIQKDTAHQNQLLCCHLRVETLSIWIHELKVSARAMKARGGNRTINYKAPDSGRWSISRAPVALPAGKKPGSVQLKCEGTR